MMRMLRFISGLRPTNLTVLLLLVAGATPALAEPDLNVDGRVLAPVVLANVTLGVVNKTIALGGDVPTATHVVIQSSGSQPLLRDNAGLFQPWDRNLASLPDNGFVPAGDNLQFQVLNQDLSASNFPMKVTVYYRAGGVLKFGSFDVFRRN